MCSKHLEMTFNTTLAKSTDYTLQLLNKVHQCFKSCKFATGKYLWLKQFPEFEKMDHIDVHGSEDQYFYSKLSSSLATSYTNMCSLIEECQQPVKIMTARIVTFM